MSIMYLKPAIINASAVEYAMTDEGMGWFPVVQALSEGYAAGKVVKKVFGVIGSDPILNGLVKRKNYNE